MIGFYEDQSVQHPLYNPSLQSTPAQLSAEDRWLAPSWQVGAVESLTVSYDGTTLLSGHQGGKVLSWNIARQKYAATVADFSNPVTSLLMLPPAGLSSSSKRMTHTVVKPRPDSVRELAGAVPAEYTFSWHMVDTPSPMKEEKEDLFSQSLNRATFPDLLIEEGLVELMSLREAGSSTVEMPLARNEQQQQQQQSSSTNGDNAALVKSLESEIAKLKQAAYINETALRTNTEEVVKLKQTASINETARRTTTEEVANLRSQLANMEDYLEHKHMKQAEVHRAKVLRQARKEEREARRREAWFEAERKNQRGDRVLKEREADSTTSDPDYQNSDES